MQKILVGIVLALIIIGAGAYLVGLNKTAVISSTPPTTAISSPTAGATTFTLAQIATHANGSSCWTTVNGKVYDVTTWISQHPGGQQAILSLCGKDGTSAFNNQHSGQSRPESELASFLLEL